ncbi:MAG: hypothetical protein QOJ81_896 [Chloroflexota bacterium]|jgi:hypothetical protein|nr:hypothetical protein [Chloroflexota bacterium]
MAQQSHSADRYRDAVHRVGRARTWLTLLSGAVGGPALLLAWPGVALAHQLNERYAAPLPLLAYVGGAALAVAMSFAFIILRNAPAPRPEVSGTSRVVPRWLRLTLQSLGLIGWMWIVVQSFAGGSGDGDVASLFLWVYGWVGLALISALGGPIWSWIDPFSTIHQILGAIAGRLGISGGESAAYPARLGKWPAVIGLAVVVWLELVARVEGGRSLGLFLVGYTVITVAAMAYYGRAAWRTNGETFSVWFGVLGRLAPFALAGEPEEGRVVRRPYASGLMSERWTVADLTLVALGTGSIIFDGLSQTQAYFDLFVKNGVFGSTEIRDSVTAIVFLGGLIAVVILMARRLGVAALGAGLLPVAVGYLVAHYLAYLLVDGQRIVAALNDPLLRGANLLPFDLGFWEPTLFIPTAVLWSIQLAAVVGGHIVGAWAGHAVMARREGGTTLVAQLPLAILMVALTTITLWSLGQAVLVTPAN